MRIPNEDPVSASELEIAAKTRPQTVRYLVPQAADDRRHKE